MSRCPSCFSGLPAMPSMWRCADQTCKPVDDSAASSHAGLPVKAPQSIELRPLENVKTAPPPPPCLTCARPMIEVCPTCHYVIPGGQWRTATVTCVALAGPRSTGKSVYVGVAVKELGRLALHLGGVLRPATPSTDRTYSEVYEAALFEQRALLNATPVSNEGGAYQREPLIYSFGEIGGKPRFLVIRDVAGEELENQAKDDPAHLRFFSRADLIIHMFDPFAVDEVRDLLHGRRAASGLADRPKPPATVLNTVLQIIAAGQGRPRYALTMSKIDIMWALRGVNGTTWSAVLNNPGAGISRDRPVVDFARIESGRLKFAPSDIDLVSNEVRSMLLRLNAPELVSGLEHPPGHPLDARYFAVSALGEEPESNRLHPRGISPFRVLDPFLWALRETWN